jgi:hypothetical protein
MSFGVGAEYVANVMELYGDAMATYLKALSVGWGLNLAIEAAFKLVRYLMQVCLLLTSQVLSLAALSHTFVCVCAVWTQVSSE